ncbi:hypothetical protein SCHPADRAFT_1003275 [Schizopora paradoxa]|uniref:Uncharacterized protein n=1 Tax=Schizopora paradoxa TaxID=27342 RepID=A0A0H2QYP4_9AGAM|nr:hypothetical protein SCHPADRAFT_1003275 [Schizopora paradoxa]
MPKTVKRNVLRHFPPLTNRSVFHKEPLSTGIVLASRTEFPLIEASAASGFPSVLPSKLRAEIPKPPGEVSRISRGGYNLEEKLGWSKSEYGKVQKGIRELAKAHLNMTAILSEQDENSLKTVFQLAKLQHPILNDYIGDWALEDFLSIMLKNSADRLKRQNKTPTGDKTRRKRSKKPKGLKERASDDELSEAEDERLVESEDD